jgi:heat shock protein HtpX
MAQAFGLYGHIRRNRIRSRLLIAGLFALVYLMCFGMILVWGDEDTAAHPLEAMVILGPLATVATAIWVFVGFRLNVGLIGRITGAAKVDPSEQPRLHRAVETLCISRGLVTPRLAVIDSPSLNAFASGVNEKQYTVTVTTGLLGALDDRELDAVLAHELTHIRNGDVRLMIIAVLIAGVVSLVGEMVFRGFVPRDRSRRSGKAVMLGYAIIALSWLLAVLVRLSLSRSREYLADAGAVELTKDPDAMISALLKVAGRADIEGVPSGVMDMCFENDPDGIADLFSTHPSIAKRVQALVETAGGRVPAEAPPSPQIGRERPLEDVAAS